MTPDVVVDVGNSRVKWGRVAGGSVRGKVSLPPDDPAGWDAQIGAWAVPGPVRWAVAGVHPARVGRFVEWVRGRGETPAVIARPGDVPVRVDVDEPSAVGIDRLLDVLAAARRVGPGSPAVVIDVGSAMTVNYLDAAGAFRGGVILPGPWMMARALHDYTAKLPLVEPEPLGPEQTVGRNTRAAIASGIQAAVHGAADVILRNISRTVDKPLAVFVTGGGMGLLRGLQFTGEFAGFEYDGLLTLDGIRLAAEGLP